jgi:hypothetical protein
MILKPIEEYRTAKRKLRKYNSIWKKYAGRNVVGCCSCLFKILEPVSYQDFLDKYIRSGENKPMRSNSYDWGKTYDELVSIAKQYHSEVNDPNISFEDCFDDLIMHVIIETFDGQNVENIVKEVLEKSGFVVEKVLGDDDAVLGIDLKVKDKGGYWYRMFLQIKPVTTFLGNKNQSLISDRINFFEKERMVIDRYGNVPYYYVLYEMDEDGVIRWLSLSNRFRLNLTDLCDENGIALHKDTDFIKHYSLG